MEWVFTAGSWLVIIVALPFKDTVLKKDWFARVPRPAGHTTIQLDTYSYTALVTEFHLQAVHLLHNK